MSKLHHYKATITWTGNRGEGTNNYRGYDRAHEIAVSNKPVIAASSDPAFLGDKTKYNPEDMLLASLSSCHLLWYLHLCADNGIIVVAYKDNASGTMEENQHGGRFTEVVLHPEVFVKNVSMKSLAETLHDEAHQKCFIANSCNFPVRHEVKVTVTN